MTAANLIVAGGCAYLLTDSVGLDEHGCVASLSSKLIASSVKRVAISSNGICWPGKAGLISSWLMKQADSDAVVKGLPGLVASLRADLEGHRPFDAAKWPPDAFNLFVAIWSRSRRRAEAYIIASHFSGFHPRMGVRANRVYQLDQHIAPEVDCRLIFSDPIRDGQALLEAQRSRLYPAERCAEGRSLHIVGGIGQLTTVSEAGVSTITLQQWPDKVGLPIEPQRVAA